MSALKSSSPGGWKAWPGTGDTVSVSPPDVSRLDTSLLPEVRLEGSEGSESSEELREEDLDSEQQAELEDWTGFSLGGGTLLISSTSSLGLEVEGRSTKPSVLMKGFTVADGLGLFMVGATAQEGFTFFSSSRTASSGIFDNLQ